MYGLAHCRISVFDIMKQSNPLKSALVSGYYKNIAANKMAGL